MNIVVSPRVAREYGPRIRKIAPGARLIVPSVQRGALRWKGDPARADVCCFSEDLWQDEELRRLALPAVFRLEGLRWFHTFSAGTDAPAFQAMVDRGTLLTNSSGASAPAIAQYVLAMMLHRAKRIGEWRDQQARHGWAQFQTAELTGQTLGIVGTGAIGGEVARLAHAFGMTVLGVRRSGKPARYVNEMLPARRLRAMLKRCDFVVLACPLTKETEGLIGEAELRAMKPAATLINVARGRIIDEAALVRALKGRWIAGACLDVFTVEPLPRTSPLWDLPNVVVTPHNSGFSPRNMERSMAIFLDNLARFAREKKLRNLVTLVG
ncbi:MAG TPA: D-2-hydroxyacid dehydrogenase [Dehalococcoidia bacterium]|nr:D-2-hydroxyacid dehydrogenase [Dehalococcoidia bacterium]